MSEAAAPLADPEVLGRLEPMLAMLADAPASLSSVTDPVQAREVHLLDSLSGLTVGEVATASRVADIGSGAGFPGIPLAVALPGVRFDLIDSVTRKADFISEVIGLLEIRNARAVCARSEELAGGEGYEAYDVVTARAVAPLTALAELASPLLRQSGVLVAWKGAREAEEEAALEMLEDRIAMRLDRVEAVKPFSGSRIRHLYVIRKTAATPDGLPRRPGMARKRPFSG